MTQLQRSAWIVLDNRHEPDMLCERHAWYNATDADNDAAYRRDVLGLPKDSGAIEVVEISLQGNIPQPLAVAVVYLSPTNELDAFGPFDNYAEADAFIKEKENAGWTGRFVARTLRN